MKSDLRSKVIDGLLIVVILMVIMFPLIKLFGFLESRGTTSYWIATLIITLAAVWTLYRATITKLSETGRAWYGLFGGLCAWTVAELSHELGMIDIEQTDILIVLALSLAFLAVLWKYFPTGAKFWIAIFLMNWLGHVFIHAAQEYLAGPALTPLFTLTAAAYGLLIIGLIYWIFARSANRLSRLWGGLWIWHAIAMIYFLLR